jgi:hypothetical protein
MHNANVSDYCMLHDEHFLFVWWKASGVEQVLLGQGMQPILHLISFLDTMLTAKL